MKKIILLGLSLATLVACNKDQNQAPQPVLKNQVFMNFIGDEAEDKKFGHENEQKKKIKNLSLLKAKNLKQKKNNQWLRSQELKGW